MRCRSPLLLSLLLSLGLCDDTYAASEAPPAKPSAEATATALEGLQIDEYQLGNGLEVIVSVDDSLPRVAVNLWYHVGPSREPQGRSGFAHLFEHLMFEGSRHVGNRYDRLLEAAGATNSNGTTSWDRTNYFTTVPSESLELVLWLESDRMGYLLDAVGPEELGAQRDVVLNERRQSYENAPYGPSTLVLLDALFPAGHPYHGAVIGSGKDIRAATVADVRAFYNAFYAPANATLAIVGAVDPAEVRALVQRYFGSLPPRGEPAADTRLGEFPASTSPRTRGFPGALPAPRAGRYVVDEDVQLAQVDLGWVAPPAFSASDPPLQAAMAVLSFGKLSRLHQRLVVDAGVATEVWAWCDPNELGTLVNVGATVPRGTSPEATEAELRRLIEQLGREGPTPTELARARRTLQLGWFDTLQLLNGVGGESGRAGIMQRFNHYLGRAAELETWPARLAHVSGGALRDAVHRYLVEAPTVAVITRPSKEPTQ